MAFFTNKKKQEIDNNSYDLAAEDELINKVNSVYSADGVHGTDGESNTADKSMDKKGKTDGVHGTDGEDFGADESITSDGKRKRRTDVLKSQGNGGAKEVQKWSGDFQYTGDDVHGTDGETIDNVPNDDEEYLTDGIHGTDGESESRLLNRMLFRTKTRERSLKGSLSAIFARWTKKNTVYASYSSPAPMRSDAASALRSTNFVKNSDAAINEALERWKEAERYFDMLPHNDLVDYAVYNLEAARRRYIFLLNLEKKQSDIAKEMGLSENFTTEKARKTPMREHMMHIPEDVLPQ